MARPRSARRPLPPSCTHSLSACPSAPDRRSTSHPSRGRGIVLVVDTCVRARGNLIVSGFRIREPFGVFAVKFLPRAVGECLLRTLPIVSRQVVALLSSAMRWPQFVVASSGSSASWGP
jgi:hypothetical protein